MQLLVAPAKLFMASLSSKAAQSHHAASSVCKELINLAAPDSGAVRVVFCEAEDAQVSDVYSFLGSKRLVDPVLQGDHAVLCCIGNSALGLQLLGDLFRAAASDMMSGAEKLTSQRLLRLGVSLLECQEESEQSWIDAISGKNIDPFMLDDNAFVCTSQPLQQNLEVVEQCIQRKAAAAASCTAGSQHFALELSAAHANEMGALTVLFLALPATAVEPLEVQSLDAVCKFAASLRSVGDVVGKPRTGFGLKPAYPKSSNGLILVLTPKTSPAGDQSLTSHLALECAKLAEDAMAVSDKELRHKLPIVPALVAYKMQPFGQDVIAWGGSDTADVSDAAGMPTAPAESTVAASVTSTSQPVQQSQPSQSSYAPITPRVSISVWQKIAELDSFDVDAWCRDMQQHGRSSSDQIMELSKIVTQFQDLLRFLASQVLSPNHGNTGPREAHGESLRESQDSMVSPRLIASPYATTPSRQVLPAHGTHSLASTGNLVALSPRNPTDRRGESLSSSPLTRSCSANYPVGSVLQQKGGTWSGLREVQSPKTLTRDLSPAELRMLNASSQPLPPGNLRHQCVQPASPWQSTLMSGPTALMAQLHPGEEVHILRSPRTEQGRDRGEGQRSPMPQPPQFAKAHPHSARAASGIVFVPGQPVPRPHPARSPTEMSGSKLRWEPSPYRVRFMSASQPQVQLAPGSTAVPRPLGPQVMPPAHHVALGHHVGEFRACAGVSPAKIV